MVDAAPDKGQAAMMIALAQSRRLLEGGGDAVGNAGRRTSISVFAARHEIGEHGTNSIQHIE